MWLKVPNYMEMPSSHSVLPVPSMDRHVLMVPERIVHTQR